MKKKTSDKHLEKISLTWVVPVFSKKGSSQGPVTDALEQKEKYHFPRRMGIL